MAEYIDRTQIFESGAVIIYPDDAEKSVNNLINRICNMPTVDVVEVVRCEDCKYCTPYEAANGCTFCKCDYVKFSGFLLDDYCSYGERKE